MSRSLNRPLFAIVGPVFALTTSLSCGGGSSAHTELSGPGLAEPKYWHGEWDHRSHTDNMKPATVLSLIGIEARRGQAKKVVEALQVLSAIFPKAKEGGESE